MNFIDWGPQIALGIEPIDEQHRFLIDLINKLSRRLQNMESRETIIDAAQGMLDYADLHFAGEEDLMRKCGYSRLEKHIAEHKVFIDKAREMGEKCLTADQEECMELFNFLAHWIIEHIMGTDKMYIPCVKKSLDEG